MRIVEEASGLSLVSLEQYNGSSEEAVSQKETVAVPPGTSGETGGAAAAVSLPPRQGE